MKGFDRLIATRGGSFLVEAEWPRFVWKRRYHPQSERYFERSSRIARRQT
jgi:hypothetical protein